jgi:hypothetical protein
MTESWRAFWACDQMPFANGAQRVIQQIIADDKLGNHYDIAPVAGVVRADELHWTHSSIPYGQYSHEGDSDSANEEQQYNRVEMLATRQRLYMAFATAGLLWHPQRSGGSTWSEQPQL